MLLVMTYEYVFLIAIISGLATGHLVTLKLARKDHVPETGQGKTPPEMVSSGTLCCNPSSTAA